MRHPEAAFTQLEGSPLFGVLARKFISRWDIYPRQLDNGQWIAVHELLDDKLLLAHLRGEMTLGAYLLDEQSRGNFLVFDADDADCWEKLIALSQSLWRDHVPSYLENSRRGGHLWLFFDQRRSGKAIRRFGYGLLASQGITKQEVELYPKQDVLKGGPGSLIRLPFGIHRKSGQWYDFVLPNGRPLATTLHEQLLLLEQAQTVSRRSFDFYHAEGVALASKRRKQQLTVPQRTKINAVLVGEPPSERIKAAVSVFDFVSQYIDLSPNGKGLCPFHEDSHPSFGVNIQENYWHCFTCGIGGSVIDFWMQWQGCDFKTAVSQLSANLLKFE